MTITEEQRERMEKWATAFDPGRERHEDDHPTIKLMRLRADDIRALLSALSTVSTRADELQAENERLRSALRSIASGFHVADALKPGQRAINIALQALEPRHD